MKLTPQQLAKILKSIKDHEASYGKTTSPTSFVYMASLLSDHITALEDENNELREYVFHKPYCCWLQSELIDRECDCGLDELFSKQEQE